MSLFGLKTTNSHLKYWTNRKIDWKQAYFDTFDHPHRDLILGKIARARCNSLLEIGCASGPNLYRIKGAFPWMDIGGVDVNEDALRTARELIPNIANRIFTGRADRIFFSDKSSDIVLTDMALIYIGPFVIDKAIKEIKRVARKQVILCEFHHKSFWKRWQLRFYSGYNVYNYQQLLTKHGFYNIVIDKISEEAWPGGNPQKTFGYIITANL